MSQYSKLCVETFLKKQGQLFDENVADNYQEAEEFLEDCMAQVFDHIEEVREYMEEEGMDVESMSDEDLKEELEVFSVSDGRYLVVES